MTAAGFLWIESHALEGSEFPAAPLWTPPVELQLESRPMERPVLATLSVQESLRASCLPPVLTFFCLPVVASCRQARTAEPPACLTHLLLPQWPPATRSPPWRALSRGIPLTSRGLRPLDG